MSKMVIWTPDKIEFIRSHISEMTYEEMGRALGLSSSTVSSKCYELGLRRQRHVNARVFTEEELEYIREHYPTEAGCDVADHLGMSYALVNRAADEMGIEKYKNWNTQAYQGRYIRNYKHNVRKVA